jgi:hypothetical protein
MGKIYDENQLIEEKIYETLIEKGHVMSMDEFFRVNGVQNDEENQINKKGSRFSISSSKRSIRLSVSRASILESKQLIPA